MNPKNVIRELLVLNKIKNSTKIKIYNNELKLILNYVKKSDLTIGNKRKIYSLIKKFILKK